MASEIVAHPRRCSFVVFHCQPCLSGLGVLQRLTSKPLVRTGHVIDPGQVATNDAENCEVTLAAWLSPDVGDVTPFGPQGCDI